MLTKISFLKKKHMKKIAIFAGHLFFPADRIHTWDEKNLETGGIGGSEVWAIMLASQFQKDGNKATVFCDCDNWHFAPDGVEYIPYRNIQSVCAYADYDLLIVSRYANILLNNLKAKRIVVMAHDCVYVNCPDYTEDGLGRADAYMFQSDFQKEQLLLQYPQLKERTWFRTSQCVDEGRYNVPQKKKNKMLWSTHKRRGSKFLIEKVLPLIRKEVPDFEIEVSGYIEDTTDTYFNSPGVKVIGCLSRDELIRHQMDSKIWIYPNWGMYDDGTVIEETFCITAIENALAKNAIVVADKTCFSSTLKGYKGFVGDDCFKEGQFIIDNEDDKDKFAKELADAAIKCLKNEKYRKELADSAYDIAKDYSMENMAKSFYYAIENLGEVKDRNTKPTVKVEDVPQSHPEQLVILTALCHRFENMPEMWKSIAQNLPNDADIHVTWAICHDTVNSPTPTGDIVQFCRDNIKNGMGWLVIPVGKEEGATYGGDLFNPAIKWLKENWMKDDNPWFYILDDDNTVCPLLGELIKDMITAAKAKNKDVILTNILYENNVLAPITEEYFTISNDKKYTPWYLIPDPSQLIMRLSFIEDMGMIQSGMYYDIEIFRHLCRNKDRISFSDDWLVNGNCSNNYQTTHNAIPDKKRIHTIYGMLCSDMAKDCTLLVSNNTEKVQGIHIDADIAKEIIKKMI